jgi:dipicolinate synthase subunit A
MNGIVFYPAGSSPALTYATRRLQERGCNIADTPSNTVTHLLLPVPSFDGGEIRGGGKLDALLDALPETVTVVGGNLQHPLLENYSTIDLLQNPTYLAENAAITADCALLIARSRLPVVLSGCSVLVLGWGRIGKCLAQMLKAVGAEVTVAARKETDLAMIQALGYRAEQIGALHYGLIRYRLIFNTAPTVVLKETQLKHCRADCVKIDLASGVGIEGADVIRARGLPGKDAPESSGLLIAKTVMCLTAGREC